jgi:hypothetical protein
LLRCHSFPAKDIGTLTSKHIVVVKKGKSEKSSTCDDIDAEWHYALFTNLSRSKPDSCCCSVPKQNVHMLGPAKASLAEVFSWKSMADHA